MLAQRHDTERRHPAGEQLLQLRHHRRRGEHRHAQRQLPEQLRRGHRQRRGQRRAAEQRHVAPRSTLTTNRDFFYPGIVTTQIDLYTPAFNAGVQDGDQPVGPLAGAGRRHAAVPADASPTPVSDFADNSVVTDVLAANQTYVPGDDQRHRRARAA